MNIEIPAGYRIIKESELDRLILNSVDPTPDPLPPAGKEYIGMPEFQNLIQSLMNQQINLTSDHVEQAKIDDLKRLDFLQSITPALDAMYYSKSSNIQDFTKQFYDQGKAKGFKEMDVDSFMGAADTNALYSLSNYNFGLIKNMSDDLRRSIGNEVFKGVASGAGIPQIADNIKQLGVEPLYNPYMKRKMTIDERSNLIAHTESVRGVNQGLITSFLNYGVSKVNSNINSTRPCTMCLDIAQGNPYDITNLPYGGPPYHPRCYCILTAAEDPTLTEAEDPIQYYNLVSQELVSVPA